MKTSIATIILVIFISSCSTPTSPPAQVSSIPIKYEPVAAEASLTALEPTQEPTLVPTYTATSTLIPSPTLTPTITPTFTPAPTQLGGESGGLVMFNNLNVLKFPLDGKSEIKILVAYSDLVSRLEIAEMSTLFADTVSPHGDIAVVWNCAAKICDTYRGMLYVFSIDNEEKAQVEVDGYPYFVGWSKNQDRLLFYLHSSTASEYYLLKTNSANFGELLDLGWMSDISWAYDNETLYAQKGGTVYHLDKDGNELERFPCQFNNACMHAQSPDGQHFAGIQKYVPTNRGNPVITITNNDFTEKKSVFISDDNALILEVSWLADSRHIVVMGITSKQGNRRMARYDYLSLIDTETGVEQVVELEVPEDSESFRPCGLTPDRKNMVYIGLGGRVKSEGRILWSSRFAQIIPLVPEIGRLSRITNLENVWESCPVWLHE